MSIEKKTAHSIKVPRLYKQASKILKEVCEEHTGLKDLVYSTQHPNLKAIYALTTSALKNQDVLNDLLSTSEILEHETRLNPWLARILITELLWGKGRLAGDSLPVITVLRYEQTLRDRERGAPSVSSTEVKLQLPRYGRVNTLQLSLEDVVQLLVDEGWVETSIPKGEDLAHVMSELWDPYFIRDPDVPNLLVFPAGTEFYRHPLYLDGSLILQDKGSCVPSILLNPKPGSVILDMCAAPGMKTMHLAALIENTGKIYAVDLNEKRCKTLEEFVNASGATCVQVMNVDATTLDSTSVPDAQYILVDPSCSCSGMVNSIGVTTDPDRLDRLSRFQCQLLRHALTSFPTAHTVVYSTCSLKIEENEAVVADVLNQVKHSFRLVDLKNKFQAASQGSDQFMGGEKCIYLKPDINLTNGFFIAMFKKKREKSNRNEQEWKEENYGDVNFYANAELNVNGKKKRKKDKAVNSVEKQCNASDAYLEGTDTIARRNPLYSDDDNEGQDDRKKESVKKHKKKKKRDEEEEEFSGSQTFGDLEVDEKKHRSKKHKKLKGNSVDAVTENQVIDEFDDSKVNSPIQKVKKKKKHVDDSNDLESSEFLQQDAHHKKRKKKKKCNE